MIMGAIIGHKSIVRVARELSVRPSPTDISDGEEQCHIIVLLLLRTGTAICKHNPVTCKFQTKQGQQFCESTCGKWGREQAIVGDLLPLSLNWVPSSERRAGCWN